MGGKPRLYVVLEPERFSAHKIDTGNCRAPKFLYVLNHQVRAAKVADERPHARVVHGVGQVAHQHNVLSLVNHLPDGKGPTEHAHVGVHAHHDDVLDATLFHQVKRLRAGGDGVALFHLDDRDLMTVHFRLGAAPGQAVAATVRIVYRQLCLVLVIQITPTLQGNLRFHLWSVGSQFAHGRVRVELYPATWAMND